MAPITTASGLGPPPQPQGPAQPSRERQARARRGARWEVEFPSDRAHCAVSAGEQTVSCEAAGEVWVGHDGPVRCHPSSGQCRLSPEQRAVRALNTGSRHCKVAPAPPVPAVKAELPGPATSRRWSPAASPRRWSPATSRSPAPCRSRWSPAMRRGPAMGRASGAAAQAGRDVAAAAGGGRSQGGAGAGRPWRSAAGGAGWRRARRRGGAGGAGAGRAGGAVGPPGSVWRFSLPLASPTPFVGVFWSHVTYFPGRGGVGGVCESPGEGKVSWSGSGFHFGILPITGPSFPTWRPRRGPARPGGGPEGGLRAGAAGG